MLLVQYSTFFLRKSSNYHPSIMDEQFWSDYEAQNDAFQETCLLNIVTEYDTTTYDKLAYRISSLGGEVYIQELITSAHL